MTSAVSPTARASTQKMLRKPTARPLKIDAPRKATPLAVPTRPLARSRLPSGTRIVTRVESAITRRFPARAPSRVSTMKSQSSGLDATVKLLAGNAR